MSKILFIIGLFFGLQAYGQGSPPNEVAAGANITVTTNFSSGRKVFTIAGSGGSASSNYVAVAAGAVTLTNNISYIDGMLTPASQLTNYTLTATVAERTLNMTNAVKFTLLSGGVSGQKYFCGVTMTNFSGANQTLAFTNTWVGYGTPPTIITNGKTARIAFEVEGANVRYGVVYQN